MIDPESKLNLLVRRYLDADHVLGNQLRDRIKLNNSIAQSEDTLRSIESEIFSENLPLYTIVTVTERQLLVRSDQEGRTVEIVPIETIRAAS